MANDNARARDVCMCRDLDVYIRKDTRESTDTYKSKKKARDELPYWWPECHLLSFAFHSLSTYNDKSRHVHGPAPDPITTLHRRGVERSLRFAILAGLWSSGMILLSGRRGLGFDSLNQSIHPSTIAPCRLCLLLRLLPPRRHRRLAQQQPQHGQSLPAVHRGGCGCGSSSGDVLLLLLFHCRIGLGRVSTCSRTPRLPPHHHTNHHPNTSTTTQTGPRVHTQSTRRHGRAGAATPLALPPLA